MNPETNSSTSQTSSKDFMSTLEHYFVAKAPFQLPASIKEAIVRFGPWLLLLAVLAGIPMILALIGIHTFTSVASFGYYAYGWSIYSIFSLATVILQALALPGLFKRSMKGWEFAFYAAIASLVGQLVYGDIIGALVGAIITFYVLFQIKSYYH